MVDLMSVPKCESSTAAVWLILSIIIPGVGQIIAGAVSNHVDSILIGAAILFLFFILSFGASLLVVLITMFTFGLGIYLAVFIPFVGIIPWVWSIWWVSLRVFKFKRVPIV
jgi:hypothetical protein